MCTPVRIIDITSHIGYGHVCTSIQDTSRYLQIGGVPTYSYGKKYPSKKDPTSYSQEFDLKQITLVFI